MLNTEQAPLKSLTPHPQNVRQGDVGAIVESLKAHGQYRPIVVQKSTGHILAGNHTFRAATALKWKDISVTYIDCDDDEALRILLVDNRANDLASYDNGGLVEMLQALADTERKLEGTGFDLDDLDQLLRDLDIEVLPPEMEGDLDEVPENVVGKTVTGDVWLLGDHRLVCGDSTSPTDMAKLMNGKKADLVWTDPPYGVSYVGKTADAMTIDNDALNVDELETFLLAALGNTHTATREGAVWYVAAPSGLPSLAFSKVLSALEVWRHTLVWVKDSLVMGRADYHYRHEIMYYGWTAGAAHRPPPDRKQDTVWEIPRPKANREHPTMKPIELITKSIENSTGKGELVIDPFGGSGSTLIAAHQTGRVAYLMELAPHYCDVICTRFQQATGIQPIAESTGNPHDFLAAK